MADDQPAHTDIFPVVASLHPNVFWGVEISDDREYVCVRRLMAGLKQTKKKTKKTLRRVLRAGRLLAVREGGILLGVIFKLLIGLGGSFSDK